jgi:hypothetical protein
MRYYRHGIFDSHFTDFELDGITGRSILAGYNNTVNQSDTTQKDQVYHIIGVDTEDTNPIWYMGLVKILTAQIKAKLGQIPVLLRVDFNPMLYGVGTETGSGKFYIYRMLRTWEEGDVTARYYDASLTLPWYQDVYAPFPGQDQEEDPTYTSPASVSVGTTVDQDRHPMDITAIIERALRDNTDIWFKLWWQGTARSYIYWNDPIISRRPQLDFYYLYPIEFYKDSGGSIDLSAAVDDDDLQIYYLGAVERGQTGTAVKAHLRNYSGETQHIEVLDDHPEYVDPIQKSGSGTGQLDYIDLVENAVSQLYSIEFYSTTEFEIKATAWRDNATSLHPQIDADSQWRGDVNTLFTAPSGGLTIPVAAWQKTGILSGDKIEVAVRGNTTDNDWAADSNDQVEMTSDNAGSPVAADWRPVTGHREKSTASVTIDAATKLIPTRFVKTGDWEVGKPAFIMDQANIDEGTVNAVHLAALGTITFSGTGLDDMSRSGYYNGNADRTYRVEIDATGTPDTFKWSRNGGTSWVATGVAITGSAQLLEDGVWVTFAATTGHTVTDYWQFTADTWGIELTGLTAGSNSYAAGSVVASSLPFRSIAAAVYTTVSQASGVSESPPSRLYLTSTANLSPADVLFIQQVGGTYEEATIDTGGVHSTYVDLTAGLTNDYAIGDFVTKKGVGEAAFWLRPVATMVTTEELKRFRLNARML